MFQVKISLEHLERINFMQVIWGARLHSTTYTNANYMVGHLIKLENNFVIFTVHRREQEGNFLMKNNSHRLQ